MIDAGLRSNGFTANSVLYKNNGNGTSRREFLAAFPDELSCFQHMFNVRFANRPCPKCNRVSKWYPILSGRKFGHPCGKQLSVTGKTCFSHSQIPIHDIFYIMLFLSNSRQGVPTSIIRLHFGLSHKAAFRILDRIRNHLALIERGRKLGGVDQVVQVEQHMLSSIRTTGRKGGGNIRVVSLSDKRAIVNHVLPRARAFHFKRAIFDTVSPGSRLITTSSKTFDHATEYGRNLPPMNLKIGDREDVIDCRIASFMALFRPSYRRVYRHLNRDRLWLYLREYEFRFNRLLKAENIFWEMLSEFPEPF